MKKRGFTLIEMLIVIIIIGILAATLIPRIGNARNRANDTARIADIKSIATAAIWYSMDEGQFPATLADAQSALVGASYGLSSWPVDPVNDATNGYTYTYTSTDSNKHFIACAKMSNGSNAGNVNFDLSNDTEWGKHWKELGVDEGSKPDNEHALAALSKDETKGTEYHCYIG